MTERVLDDRIRDRWTPFVRGHGRFALSLVAVLFLLGVLCALGLTRALGVLVGAVLFAATAS
jgi:hypothetical protein